MNNRLTIAATILSNGTTKIQRALEMADELIALEKATRLIQQKDDKEKTYTTAAYHIKKGDVILKDNTFIEVANVDNNYDNDSKTLFVWLYFTDTSLKSYAYNEEVTVKEI